MTWYNKYRPQKFEDVVGQDLIKQVLQRTLETGRIKQAYLLSGPKGTGKTTMARIFAKSLNEVEIHPQAELDIIEMDAASNTGIEDIRQLIDSAQVPPIAGKYKIYIIDEVHMLSKSALNALLKILEEPPAYLVFLLATTNPEKLLPTVLSRLTKLNLTSHSIKNIVSRLDYIAKNENMKIDENSLILIAKRSDGGQRDAINLLETLHSYELESYDQISTANLLGLLPNDLLNKIATTLTSSRLTQDLLQEMDKVNVDGETLLAQLLDFVLDKSLSGDLVLDSLIIPLAEILSLRLSITSPTSALAILQVKLGLTSSTINVKPTSSPKPPVTPTPESKQDKSSESSKSNKNESKSESESNQQSEELSLSSKSNIISFNIPETSNNPNPATSLSPNEDTAPSSDTKDIPNQSSNNNMVNQVSKEEILTLIKSLSKNPKTLPTLKIMLSDIRIDEIDSSNTIASTVSNGIFLSQMRGAKIQQYIKEALKDKFGIDYNITVELRAKDLNPVPHSDINQPENSFNQSDNSNTSSTEKALPAQNQVDTSSPDPKVKATKNSSLSTEVIGPSGHEVFYQAFNSLPDQMQNSGVKVFAGLIPDPSQNTDPIENIVSGSSENAQPEYVDFEAAISDFELME